LAGTKKRLIYIVLLIHSLAQPDCKIRFKQFEVRLMRHFFLIMSTLLISHSVLADSPVTVKDKPLDHATLNVGQIAVDSPIHIHLFETSGVKLGKAKHQDTARMMAGTVPHLLAVDIVESLRADGFGNVTLDDPSSANKGPDSEGLSLQGRFTELNPGSQATRQWIGFGAGKSKVCIEGQLLDSEGNQLGEFTDCRSGLGWGGSAGELQGSAQSIGDGIAKLLGNWAHGKYKRD
jgi:hypothetical protein